MIISLDWPYRQVAVYARLLFIHTAILLVVCLMASLVDTIRGKQLPQTVHPLWIKVEGVKL